MQKQNIEWHLLLLNSPFIVLNPFIWNNADKKWHLLSIFFSDPFPRVRPCQKERADWSKALHPPQMRTENGLTWNSAGRWRQRNWCLRIKKWSDWVIVAFFCFLSFSGNLKCLNFLWMISELILLLKRGLLLMFLMITLDFQSIYFNNFSYLSTLLISPTEHMVHMPHSIHNLQEAQCDISKNQPHNQFIEMKFTCNKNTHFFFFLQKFPNSHKILLKFLFVLFVNKTITDK